MAPSRNAEDRYIFKPFMGGQILYHDAVGKTVRFVRELPSGLIQIRLPDGKVVTADWDELLPART